tara:strand:- start:641 stop:1414 length:774 start_codon:yes stop_codon:yes gene_type:complete
MRLITINLNGIRSASSKGFFEWLNSQKADIVCVQETRIQPEQMTQNMIRPGLHRSSFEFAEKRGYSGVGLYFKKKPDKIYNGIGWPLIDREGRFIQADFGGLSVISLYLPSGSSGNDRQQFKFEVLAYFEKWLKKELKSSREYIICGDLNIAHEKIDIKNWKSNQKNSGFLPEERAWMSKLFNNLGLLDVFRSLNKNPDQYTWWSNRGRAWEKNVGWRIDYQIATSMIGARAKSSSIFKEKRFSDHSPLIIDYDYNL